MSIRVYQLSLSTVALALYLTTGYAQTVDSTHWTFVSIPDFLNVDVRFPEPTWDEALDFTLASLKGEQPDFVLVAGDMVMGRWWRSKEQIAYMADIFYTAWKERMNKFGLRYYVAVGDHEVGDNPWTPDGKRTNRYLTWDSTPLAFLPYFEKAFANHFDMPINGSTAKKGLDYFVRHNNALIVTLDVFDQNLLEQHGEAEITEAQLQWLDSLLTAQQDVTFTIVQAHTPIIGPVRKKNSSGLMYRGGRNSPLWQTMKKHDVDVYLCGEVHAITAIEKDGIQQISHGSLLGYNEEAHYLVAHVSDHEMQFELKWIPMKLGGRHLMQSAGNEPREYVTITPKNKARGFYSVGTMTLRKADDQKQFLKKTGYFREDDNPQ